MIQNLRTRDRILFFLGSTGILSGIFLTNIFRENTLFLFLFVCIVSIQILFIFRSYLFFAIVFIFSFSLGGHLSLERIEEIDTTTTFLQEETGFFTQAVSVRGTLAEKVSETGTSARYILRNITVGTREFPEEIGILLQFPDSRKKELDDILSFTGKLFLPSVNEAFDYRTYLLLNDVYATASIAFPDKIGTDPSPFWKVFIRETREKLLGLIEDIYPGESAKLLEGILIGERANLSAETKNHFNASGLTHIIAVSGFNITIILIFLSFLFRSFPVPLRLLLALIVIGFFTLLVGPQVPVLRASAFGLIAYTILLSGKKMRSFPLLIAVALGFVLYDPPVLNFDVSFHLSFLAVLGLLFFGDFFARVFSFLPKWFGFREALAMCFAAMVFTLPILMVNFGQISVISPLANVLVVPFIPLVMLGGFLSMLGALFSSTLGIWLGFPTWFGLSYILGIASWLGGISFATLPVELGEFVHVFEIGYFLTVIFLVAYFREEK